MTSAKDLMSLGMAWPLAQAEGFTSVSITAAGTTTANATVCDVQNDVFIVTATGSDGVRMNGSTPLLQPIFFVNITGGNALVYPPTGAAFNGGSTDAAITVGANKTLITMRYSTTGCLSNLSA